MYMEKRGKWDFGDIPRHVTITLYITRRHWQDDYTPSIAAALLTISLDIRVTSYQKLQWPRHI
jgi:hypothetical protein